MPTARRPLAALALVLALASPALAGLPQYQNKPTSPGYQSGVAGTANANLVVPFTQGSGLPIDLIGPTTPTASNSGGQVNALTWGTDSTSGWGYGNFTNTTKVYTYTGRTVPTNSAAFCGMVLFRLNTHVGGFVVPLDLSGAGHGPTLQKSGASDLKVLYAGATITITGGMGHRILTAVTQPVTNTTTDLYAYDFDTKTSYSNSHSSSASGAAASTVINGNPDAATTWDVDIFLAAAMTRNITSTDFNNVVADPYGFIRRGSFAASPATANQNATYTITFDGSATASDVASRFQTDGFTPTVSDPNSLGNPPTITGLTITSETAATATLTVPAAAGIGTYAITNTVGASNYRLDLPVAAYVGPATGYSLTGPSTATVNAASSNFTVTPTPSGGTWPASTTLTPSVATITGTFAVTSGEGWTPTGTNTVTFTLTPTSAGTGSVTVANNQGLTAPAGVSVTASVAPVIAGTITQGTTAVDGWSGGRPTASIAFTGTASTGGQGTLAYQWYLLPTGGGFYGGYTGSGSNIAAYAIAGATGQNLTLTAQPFQTQYYLVRRTTDPGQPGQAWDALWKPTGSSSTSTVLVGAATPKIRILTIFAGDSAIGFAAAQKASYDTTLANGRSNFVTSTSLDVSVGGTKSSDWLPTASNVHSAGDNPSSLNYLNYLLWKQAQQAGPFDVRLVYYCTGGDAQYPQAGTGSTLIANLQTIRTAIRSYSTPMTALVVGAAGQAPTNSLDIIGRNDLIALYKQSLDYSTILPGEYGQNGFFSYEINLQNSAYSSDFIHPDSAQAGADWMSRIGWAVNSWLFAPSTVRPAAPGGGGGGNGGVTIGGGTRIGRMVPRPPRAGPDPAPARTVRRVRRRAA